MNKFIGMSCMRIVIAGIFALCALIARAEDLPSWRDGATKQSIIEFVKKNHDQWLAGFYRQGKTHPGVR